MNKKVFLFVTVVAILITIISACAPSSAAEPEVVVEQAVEEVLVGKGAETEALAFTDDLGNVIELDDNPEAIVSLSPSTTEILFAVGAGGQVSGRDEMSLAPEAALSVPSVGAMWGDLPAEAILAAEPDLIFVAEIINEDQVQAMQDLGLQVFWQANPTTFEELWDNLREIGSVTGHEDAAEVLIAELQARVENVVSAVADAEERPSVFYELDATDPSNPWTAGSGTFIDLIISTAGGTNAAADLQGDYAQMSAEALIAADPDIIVLGDAPFGVTPESVAQRAGWENLTAVVNGDVYPFNPDILSIPGPRLVEGLEEMARILQPDLFP